MRFTHMTVLAAIAGAALLTGCETTGGQTKTTIYDMHRRVVKLDKDLGESINQLNTTSATLNQRVDDMDGQTRELRSLLEENQRKLDEIKGDMTRLFRAMNLSQGVTAPTGTVTPSVNPNVQAGTPQIVPPAQTPGAAPVPGALPTPSAQNELLDSAPVPTGVGAAAPAAAPAAPAAVGDPNVLYNQAQNSYSSGDYKTAMQRFDEFLGQFPTSENAHNALFWKAKCQLNLGGFADAVQSFEGVRSKFPNSTKVPFAMHNQAVAHSRLGQTEEAIRLMQAVVDQFPMSPVAEQAKSDLKRLKGEQ